MELPLIEREQKEESMLCVLFGYGLGRHVLANFEFLTTDLWEKLRHCPRTTQRGHNS